MIDVTVILLNGGLPSTSLAPLEIFACAGSLWGAIMGAPSTPLFRVRTATIDGRKVDNFVPVSLAPTVALRDVGRTDLVVVPAAGMDLEIARERNGALIEWLERRRNSQTAVAGVCTGVSLIAAAGLLDGRIATTHWGMVDRSRQLYPKVRWTADRLVTESGNIFCGGGLYASIDMSLYLVERYCGHLVAVQTAKALLLEMPRLWQTAYAVRAAARGARRRGHRARREVACRALPRDRRSRRAGGEGGHEPAQLRAPLQSGDGRDAARVPPPAAHLSGEAPPGKRAPFDPGDQP